MPFSILLLTDVSSERHITGAKGDRVIMPDLLPGEVALFFDKVDGDPVRQSLGLNSQKCCDGIIFYANKTKKNICLVEMKTSNLGEAKEQIEQTYNRLHFLLKQNCASCQTYLKQIIWQAYIYHSGSAPKGGYRDCEDELKRLGFTDAWVRGERDITRYLRMESGTMKSKKSPNKNRP